MYKILFVCHGNICRSPMAEYCMKDLSQRAGYGDSLYVESAATSSEELGNPVYPPAGRVLSSRGIDCAGKRARRITPEDYDRFDLIVGMDKHNLRNMARAFGGDPKGKICLLLSFSGSARDVEDPWFTGDFEGVWMDIQEGCNALFNELIRKKRI